MQVDRQTNGHVTILRIPSRGKVIRNLSSPIDMHTNANSASDKCVTLTFDLLTSESMHAE